MEIVPRRRGRDLCDPESRKVAKEVREIGNPGASYVARAIECRARAGGHCKLKTDAGYPLDHIPAEKVLHARLGHPIAAGT